MEKTKKHPQLSIFIPTGSRSKSLMRVLDSLSKQEYKNFEVLIVDYKSKDDTLEVINNYRKKLDIVLINQTEKGLSKAANLALDKARGDIFIRTDDDVFIHQGWSKAIAQTFAEDPKVGGVTGPTVIPQKNLLTRDLFSFERQFRKGNLFMKIIGAIYFNYFMEGKPYAVSQWFRSGAFSLGSNYRSSLKEPLQEVTNLEACNMSLRTKLLRKVGGFDPVYGGVGEYHEADAALKIKDLGYKLVFNPKVYLNHCPSQGGFYSDRKYGHNRMVNFIIFHHRFLKSKNLDAFFKYFFYLIFLNCYYVFLAITKHQFILLSAILGTIDGLLQIALNKTTFHAKS